MYINYLEQSSSSQPPAIGPDGQSREGKGGAARTMSIVAPSEKGSSGKRTSPNTLLNVQVCLIENRVTIGRELSNIVGVQCIGGSEDFRGEG